MSDKLPTVEEWRPIPNFRTYEVSRSGHVRNAETGRMLKWRLRNGVRVVSLTNGSHSRQAFQVAALVAAAFEPRKRVA